MFLVDWINQMFDWILTTLGISGAALGVAAWFLGLPKLLSIASNIVDIVSPLLKGISEGLVEFTKVIYIGFRDIIDNVNTVITVLLFGCVVYLGSILYTQKSCTIDCEQCITDLRKDYKFIERTPSEKKAYLKKIGKGDDSGFFETFNPLGW